MKTKKRGENVSLSVENKKKVGKKKGGKKSSVGDEYKKRKSQKYEIINL